MRPAYTRGGFTIHKSGGPRSRTEAVRYLTHGWRLAVACVQGETSEPGAIGAVQFLLGSGWPVGNGPPNDKLRQVLKVPNAVSSRVRQLPLHEAP